MDKRVLADKYELQKKIGEGGSGIVYLAWDRHMECMVAVKEEKLKQTEVEAGLLKKEMEYLKSLKHPMLPVVHDYFHENSWYLVMEYIEGHSLHNYIEKGGCIEEEQACRWGLQLLELLSYLHGQRPAVIYRDLKPENIVVCKDFRLRVVDFGAAIFMNYDSHMQESIAGTAGYAAPEQLGEGYRKGGRVDERSDIYTFGATMYHMLTGFNPSRPPYGVRALRRMNPGLTSGIEKIVSKCTEAEPDKRYQSVEEIKRDLKRKDYIGRRKVFARFSEKNGCVIKKLEKNIWLTGKKTTGLV